MFISKDPIEFESGDFNHYRYVGNDPVNFRDPSGLTPAPGMVRLGPTDIGRDVKAISNSFGNLVDGIKGYFKSMYSVGDWLGRRSGFRDIQEGNIIGICKAEAKAELELMLYGLENHRSKILGEVWKDIKERPAYYLGGSFYSPFLKGMSLTATQTAAVAAGVFKTKTFGAGIDYIHNHEKNPLRKNGDICCE